MIIILLQKSQPKKLKKSYLEKEKEEKEVQELKKNKKKKIKDITKPDLTDYKSLTEQDSWQALYQIFPINLLFIRSFK